MVKNYKKIILLVIGLLLYISAAAAAASSEIQNIRFSQSPARVRIVLDMSSLPDYKANLLSDKGGQLIVDLPGTVNKAALKELPLTDPAVSSVRLDDSAAGKIRAVIDLKNFSSYKVFTLTAPNRLVIDILKDTDQKTQHDVAPGLQYTERLRYTDRGPVFTYILDVDTKILKIKPVLSNDEVAGLEQLSSIASRNQALAAINGSYFAPNGETIGTLKIDGQIAGIPELPRTAFGVLADGKVILSKVNYQGTVILPNGQTADIGGVDCERSPDGLILYNRFYGERTGTNEFGIEYVIIDNLVSHCHFA